MFKAFTPMYQMACETLKNEYTLLVAPKGAASNWKSSALPDLGL